MLLLESSGRGGVGGIGVTFWVESLIEEEFPGCVHLFGETRSEREEHTAIAVAGLMFLPASYVVLSWSNFILFSEVCLSPSGGGGVKTTPSWSGRGTTDGTPSVQVVSPWARILLSTWPLAESATVDPLSRESGVLIQTTKFSTFPLMFITEIGSERSKVVSSRSQVLPLDL